MIKGVFTEFFIKAIAMAFVVTASQFLGKFIQKIRYGETDEPPQGGEGIGLVAFAVLMFAVCAVGDLFYGHYAVADFVILGAILVFCVIAFIRIRTARRKKEEKQQTDAPTDE